FGTADFIRVPLPAASMIVSSGRVVMCQPQASSEPHGGALTERARWRRARCPKPKRNASAPVALGAEPAAAAHMANVRQPTEYPQPRAGRRFRFVDRDNGLGRPFGASESLAWPRGPRSDYARPERCEVQADHASPKDRFGAEG